MTTHTPLRCANSFMVQRGSSEVVLLDTGAYPGHSNFLNETWTFNGTDWTNTGATLIDANGPLPGRLNMVGAFDGYNVMLYGGQGDSASVGALEDTWVWGGSSWTKLDPATKPFGRYLARACQETTSTLSVIMFGGFGGGGSGGYLNETWVWDGYVQTWSLLSPTHKPSARIAHCMAGGPSYLVMFGGSISSGEFKNDTWKFDGVDWTQLAPATSPSARSGACMTYDVANSEWVMFGGMNEYYRLPETWTFDGTTWTQKSPATSPSGLTFAQMCYDSQSGAVLLFGGFSATDNYVHNETWSWDGTTWTKL